MLAHALHGTAIHAYIDPPGTTRGRFSAVLWQSHGAFGRRRVSNSPGDLVPFRERLHGRARELDLRLPPAGPPEPVWTGLHFQRLRQGLLQALCKGFRDPSCLLFQVESVRLA